MPSDEVIGYIEVTPAMLVVYGLLVISLVTVALAFGAYLGGVVL
jgi:preprotein translocase subunit Sec61beta